MKEYFKYFNIGNRYFKIEKVNENFYELTMFEDKTFIGTWCFTGKNAYAEIQAEILSYSEISEEDYNEF